MSNGVLIGPHVLAHRARLRARLQATDAVNFAQGEFVMIAGLAVALSLSAAGAPLWWPSSSGSPAWSPLASPSSGCPAQAHRAARDRGGDGHHRLASILRGVGPTFFGAGTKTLPLPISDEPFVLGPLFIPPIQVLGAAVSVVFLSAFGWFFLMSRKGIAMRAVADNQQVRPSSCPMGHQRRHATGPMAMAEPSSAADR